MLPEFKILYLFDSNSSLIIKIKVLDLPVNADLSEKFHWIYFDKRSGKLTKLIFKSMDSSPTVEERYFEQGYLKFNEEKATFIEKFNSSQHHMDNKSTTKPEAAFIDILKEYLS